MFLKYKNFATNYERVHSTNTKRAGILLCMIRYRPGGGIHSLQCANICIGIMK